MPYTLTVTNTGPVTATAVVVTDVLPVGLTFVSSTPTCTAAAQTVTCALGDLAASATATIELTTQAANPFPTDDIEPDGTVPNIAQVTSPGSNCVPDTVMFGRMGRVDVGRLLQQALPDECDDDHTLPVMPTIAIVKTSSATQIVPGAQVPYTFTVTNTGSVPATEVVVTDQLPVGLTFVSSPDGCTADAAQLITCDIGGLAMGAVATRNVVTLAANPFPDTAIDPDGMVPNTASVTSPDSNCPPPVPPRPPRIVGELQGATDDCNSTIPLPVPPTIAITKTSTSTQFAPGGEVTYVITVSNTGLVAARDVVVTDNLPSGLTFVSSVPPCTASGQVVTCPMGELAAGASANIDVVTRAADPFPTDSIVNGEVVNVAVVSATGSNCGPGSTDPVCTDRWPVRPMDPEPSAGSSNALPFTGGPLRTLLEIGIAVLVAGTLVTVGSRRRRKYGRASRATLGS